MRYLILTALADQGTPKPDGVLPEYIAWTPTSEENMEAFTDHKYVAEVTEADYNRLAREWELDPEKSEPNLGILTGYGYLDSDLYIFDGMDWNVGGVTPVHSVELRVSEPLADSEDV